MNTLLAMTLLLGADPIREAPVVVKPGEADVGRLMPDFAFTDSAGKQSTLAEALKNKPFLVVAMADASCPLCKKYAPTWVTLQAEYAAKGVGFVFVNPTASDSAAAIAQLSQNLKAPVIHDKDLRITAAIGAKVTTDVFVIDNHRTVVYRGAVDDQYGIGFNHDAPKNKYLADALTTLLAGKTPFVQGTLAVGCVLDVKAGTVSNVTYHGRVSRILQNNCVECHRTGGVAPFKLDTYEDAIAHAGMIRKVVDKGTMPPWFAAKPKAGGHTPWVNDRSLAEAEMKDLLAWCSADKAPGDAKDAVKAKTFGGNGWAIGKPDAIYELPKAIDIKASGQMPYQNVTMDTNLTEDKWVTAIEVKPTAREVVHHVLVFVQPKNAKITGVGALRVREGDNERQGFFAIYVPGNSVLTYPDGYAKKLPKDSTLRFQIHYTPNGTATKDRTQVGVIFGKEKPLHEVKVAGIIDPRISIPPGADNHKEVARLPVPMDVKVLAFAPHMHVRGKAAKYEARTPDGKTQTMLDIPNYDFNWQLLYRYSEPLSLPRGSSIIFTGTFDNSDKNPANPDPTKTVKWGPQTTDEMLLGYVEYIVVKPNPLLKKQ